MNNMSEKASAVCSFLEKLGIEFSVVVHLPVFSIEECEKIEEIIGGEICKNLFLQTSSRSVHYILMIKGGKRFVTKDVSKKLGTSRLSFASGEEMERLLNTSSGSLSVTSLIFDKSKSVSLAIDADVLKNEFICCHPSDNSATLKIRTADILNVLLPELKIEPQIIEI